ncbi:MmgE/PrpD family protein [Aurantivibrio plasticivorans]
MSSSSLSAQLAQFVSGTRFEQLDSETVSATKVALLDGLGVALAATRLGEGVNVFRDQALAASSVEESRVWGTGTRSLASLAALANGSLSHALDFEDTHDEALVHPNAAVIPAVFAAAESLLQQGVSINGKQLLTSIAVGCDIVCRLGLALTVPLDRYAWYPPPILSAYGATAAVANLYQLNEQQVLDAFSLTLLQTSCSGEIKYNPTSVIRAVRDAFPAQLGVSSVQLAKRGLKGFTEPFEGKAGFFAMFARDQYDVGRCIDGLGQEFQVKHLSFKLWPSCRGTHAFIDMTARVLKEHKISITNVSQVRAFGNGINRMLAEPIEAKQKPSTSIDAKFSIPYCVAWTAVYGSPSLNSFLPESLADKSVLAFAQKVSYQVESHYADRGNGMLRGRLEVVTADGRTLHIESHGAPGSPAQALSQVALREKFRHCCSFAMHELDEQKIHALADSILTLEQVSDLESSLFNYL